MQRDAFRIAAVACFLDETIEEVVRAAVRGNHLQLPAPGNARVGDVVEGFGIFVQSEFVQNSRSALAGLGVDIGRNQRQRTAVVEAQDCALF